MLASLRGGQPGTFAIPRRLKPELAADDVMTVPLSINGRAGGAKGFWVGEEKTPKPTELEAALKGWSSMRPWHWTD